MNEIKNLLKRLNSIADTVVTKQIDFEPNKGSKQYAFSEQKKIYYENQIKNTIKLLQNKKTDIPKIIDDSQKSKHIVELIANLNPTNIILLKDQSEKLLELTADIIIPDKDHINLPKNIPLEIREEVFADIRELYKCMDAKCYRSVIILCGRILETVLHRKYYDLTGKDILETNPGIGLGTLIAKIKEQNVQLDPALTQQIHLINQIRIFSVHKKQETFHPTINQTKAIVLYTLDIIEKLF